MTVSLESTDWLAKYKNGDTVLNERTNDDGELAHYVAFASKAAYEAGLAYEAEGNREAAINNYVEAYRIGQFIARLYDTNVDSRFLANWQ